MQYDDVRIGQRVTWKGAEGQDLVGYVVCVDPAQAPASVLLAHDTALLEEKQLAGWHAPEELTLQRQWRI